MHFTLIRLTTSQVNFFAFPVTGRCLSANA